LIHQLIVENETFDTIRMQEQKRKVNRGEGERKKERERTLSNARF